MAGTYTRWYREGTVKLVTGSTSVVGTNTFWLTAGLNPGDIFSVDGVADYEIAAIADNTHLTLSTAFNGSSQDEAAYHIVRNFTAHVPSRIASQLTQLYYDLVRYWDQDMQTIHGKSAYEIAKEHGFTGTEAQWLESLKGAGEIVTLNERTNILTYNSAAAHNSIYRGKNLGTAITAAQIAAIRNGTYEDIYPGDYWRLPIDGTTTAIIMGCGVAATGYNNEKRLDPACNIILWLQNSSWNYPINDTNTTEGHLYNSKLFNETFPALLAKIEAVIPADYIKTLTDNIADSIDANGMPNHKTLTDMRIFLPSAQNLNIYDTNAFTNSAYSISSRNVWPYFTHKPASYWFTCWIDTSNNKNSWLMKAPQVRILASANASSNILCLPYVYIG